MKNHYVDVLPANRYLFIFLKRTIRKRHNLYQMSCQRQLAITLKKGEKKEEKTRKKWTVRFLACVRASAAIEISVLRRSNDIG